MSKTRADDHDRGNADAAIFADEIERAGFTVIPNVVLDMPGVSHGAKATYNLLRRFAWQTNTCFPGQDTLADLLGVKRAAVGRYLRELQRAGLIDVRRRGLSRTNVYIIKPLATVPGIAGLIAQHSDVSQSRHLDVSQSRHLDVSQSRHKKDTEEEDSSKKTQTLTPRARGRAGAGGRAREKSDETPTTTNDSTPTTNDSTPTTIVEPEPSQAGPGGTQSGHDEEVAAIIGYTTPPPAVLAALAALRKEYPAADMPAIARDWAAWQAKVVAQYQALIGAGRDRDTIPLPERPAAAMRGGTLASFKRQMKRKGNEPAFARASSVAGSSPATIAGWVPEVVPDDWESGDPILNEAIRHAVENENIKRRMTSDFEGDTTWQRVYSQLRFMAWHGNTIVIGFPEGRPTPKGRWLVGAIKRTARRLGKGTVTVEFVPYGASPATRAGA